MALLFSRIEPLLLPQAEHPRAGRLIVVALLLALAGAAGVALLKGPVVTSDGWRDHYLARALIDAGFLPWRWLEQVRPWMDANNWPQSPLPYLAYHSVLAWIELLFGEHWYWGLTVFNVACQAATAGILAYLVLRLGGTGLGALACGLSCAACWEFVQWVPQTQMDTSFVTLIAATLALFAMAVISRYRPALLAALALVLLANLYKPTGAVMLVYALVVLFAWWRLDGRDLEADYRTLRTITLVALVALLISLPLLAYPLYQPGILPDGAVENSFAGYHERAANGEVVWSRADFSIAPMQGYGDFVTLVFARLLAFFWFTAEDFSRAHVLINVGFFVPFYGLVLLGAGAVFLSRGLDVRLRLVGLLAVGLTALFDGFHAVTLLDFDWRYRSPTYPALFVLMVCGLDWIIVRFIRKRHADASTVVG